MVINGSQNVYMSFSITNSSNIFYSKFINNSSNIWFSSNLTACHECILCHNLDNKKYCIKNKTYTQEEYFSQKQEILKRKNHFLEFYKNIDET